MIIILLVKQLNVAISRVMVMVYMKVLNTSCSKGNGKHLNYCTARMHVVFLLLSYIIICECNQIIIISFMSLKNQSTET